MKLTKDQARYIWIVVFNELLDRKGFDDWWESIDQKTVEEISGAIQKKLEETEFFEEEAEGL